MNGKEYVSLIIVVTLVIFQNCVHGSLSIDPNNAIIVDINETGNFTSVQAAIDHVPEGNSKWITILVRAGIYNETVSIPSTKPFIYMKGEGKGKTSIVGSQSAEKSDESAIFKVEAAHFFGSRISFKNTGPERNSVAAMVAGDKVAFYDCGFFSNHNTLYEYKGRHYYSNCYIQGSVDFIFGPGKAMFHECEMFVIGNRKSEIRGSIAAHHKETEDDDSGFVFLKGRVYGSGAEESHLGSAKDGHSKVVFANTYLSKAIKPIGWVGHPTYQLAPEKLYHAEYKCHGPGSDSQHRAQWSKQLSDEEASPFLTQDFVQGKEWMPRRFLTELDISDQIKD